jgi:mannosyltransferase
VKNPETNTAVTTGRLDQNPLPPATATLRTWLILGAIVAVGIALRCYGMSIRSLWFDEALTYWTSQLSPSEFPERIKQGVHPPLHYVVLRAWTEVFGTSIWALRSLGVVLGGLTIIGIYLFTVEALRGQPRSGVTQTAPAPHQRETGLWVAALVALSILQIRAAWDVRMYALGTALAAFSSWALFRALHAPPRRFAYWLLYGLLAVLLIYTHYFAWLTIAAQGLFVAGYLFMHYFRGSSSVWRQPQLPGALLAGMIILAGGLAWLPTFLYQRSHDETTPWVPAVSWISACVNGYHMMIEPEAYVPAQQIGIGALCAFLCLVVPFALLWKPRSAAWYVVAAVLVPIGLGLIASVAFSKQVFYSRYLLFAHLFILVSCGLLLGRIGNPWLRRTVGGLLLLLLLGLDLRVMSELDLEHKTSSRGVVAYIESHRQPGEPVVVSSELLYLPLLYHASKAPGGTAGWYQYGSKQASPTEIDRDAWTAMGLENVLDPVGYQSIAASRVWVVQTRDDNGQWQALVSVPSQWTEKSRAVVQDTYGLKADLVIIEYEVH